MPPHDRALELLRLAQRDERGAHVLQTDPSIDHSLSGFHYQQAAEKMLKALLAEQDIDFPKTHDLAKLIQLVEQNGYEIPVSKHDLRKLSPFAATVRYEEDMLPPLDLVETEALIRQLRTWTEEQLERPDSMAT
jgi:HEPN domain-containing protein